MTDDPWRCRWCKVYTHPVARMVSDHEERCEVRPDHKYDAESGTPPAVS